MIETERLILRPWREEDIAPYAAISTDAEVMLYLGGVQSRGEAEAAIVRRMTDQVRLGYTLWAVQHRRNHMFLGFCGLQPGPPGTPIESGIEIGWRLARDAWGRGYALEAAGASLDWGWAKLDTPSIAAITVPANARSWGLMERLGMTRCPEDNFDHPDLAPGDPLRAHIVYRIARPADAPARAR